MTVTFQAFFQAAGTTASTVTVSWPTHLTDDVGILVVESDVGTAFATPTGWTAVNGTTTAGVTGTTGTQLGVWWQRATSSSMGAAVVSLPTGGDHLLAAIYTFRGCVTSGSPVNASGSASKTVGSTSYSSPSITTTAANCLVLYCVTRGNDSASTAAFTVGTNANLTSISEIDEVGSTIGNGGGFVIGAGTKAVAGATGATTGTVTSSSNASVSLALEPKTLSELICTQNSFTLAGTSTLLQAAFKLNNTLQTYLLGSSSLILSPTVALDTTVGVFNLTGNSVDLTYTSAAGLELICQLGSFTWTGISSILTQQLILNSTAGSFAVDGLSLNQQRLFLLNGNTESFLVDEKFISLSLGKNLNTTTGTFLLNGINLDSAFTYAIIGSKGSFLIRFNPADVAKNFQLVSSTGTYTLTGISSDAVKNYPIVALPQSYLVGTTGIDYFSTRRLEASTAPFVMTLQSNGDFFWYQTTQTIPIIKPRLTNRNQWILGRATHMGRRGL
jgi:hypothetical protein